MGKYLVSFKQQMTHTVEVEVEADSEADAILKVEEGEYDLCSERVIGDGVEDDVWDIKIVKEEM